MQLKQTALAVAVALAAPAAFAAAPAGGPFGTPDLVVKLSGATAPDQYMQSIAVRMFEPGYYSYYSNEASDKSKALHRAFYGVVKNDPDIPSELHGKKVLFKKRSRGGSVIGVNPVARANAIKTLEIVDGAGNPANGCVTHPAGTDSGATATYSCRETGTDEITDITNPGLLDFVQDFGVSDVAPFMFKEPLNTEFNPATGEYTPQLTPAEAGRLESKAVNTLMMGLAVTNAVPNTTHFSRSAYGSILNGNIASWSQLGVSLAHDQVVVCRRVPGSGTQTSYNWFFGNFPCAAGSLVSGVSGDVSPLRMSQSVGMKPLLDTDGNGVPDCQDTNENGVCDAGEPTGGSTDRFIIDPSAGLTVVENSTSGQVRGCLEKANNGGNHDFDGEDGKKYRVTFGAGGYGAVGVLSVDSGGLENGWSYRGMDGAGSLAKLTLVGGKQPSGPGSYAACSGLDYTGTGVAPRIDELRDGKYDFAAELTMQYRKEDVKDAGDTITVKKLKDNTDGCNLGAACIAGDGESLKYKFVNTFIARAGHPDFQSCATAALPIAFDPLAGTIDEDPATDEYDARRVAKGYRGAGDGNMCAPLSIVY